MAKIQIIEIHINEDFQRLIRLFRRFSCCVFKKHNLFLLKKAIKISIL